MRAMLIAVVLGYLVATMFLIAGVSRAVQVCMDLRPGIDFNEMMNLLLEPAFMAGVSVVMLLLIQIATFLERLMYSQLREEKRRAMGSRKSEEPGGVPAAQAAAPTPVQESPSALSRGLHLCERFARATAPSRGLHLYERFVRASAPAPVQESPVVQSPAAAAPVEEAKPADSQVS